MNTEWSDKDMKTAHNGVDPIAYCGLSCGHCFLKDRCKGCRTIDNICSNAMMYPDKICPNAACCKKKNLDGCYDCEDLYNCQRGFYSSKDGNAVKALALFIHKYGKKELKKVLENLHRQYDFRKIQQIIGYDTLEGLRILEDNR